MGSRPGRGRAVADERRDQALVTGYAGFVGSHLAERLLVDGRGVPGVDCLTDYYSHAIKKRNLAALLRVQLQWVLSERRSAAVPA